MQLGGGVNILVHVELWSFVELSSVGTFEAVPTCAGENSRSSAASQSCGGEPSDRHSSSRDMNLYTRPMGASHMDRMIPLA